MIEDFTTAARRALDAIRHFPLPVVAALNGDALGGGAGLRSLATFVRGGAVLGLASCRASLPCRPPGEAASI
jgi:enoyl-CoA hydratase/carnithine racemase